MHLVVSDGKRQITKDLPVAEMLPAAQVPDDQPHPLQDLNAALAIVPPRLVGATETLQWTVTPSLDYTGLYAPDIHRQYGDNAILIPLDVTARHAGTETGVFAQGTLNVNHGDKFERTGMVETWAVFDANGVLEHSNGNTRLGKPDDDFLGKTVFYYSRRWSVERAAAAVSRFTACVRKSR